jgi:hypothetical protein
VWYSYFVGGNKQMARTIELSDAELLTVRAALTNYHTMKQAEASLNRDADQSRKYATVLGYIEQAEAKVK